MESDLSTCLRQLKTCLDTQQIPQARSIIDRITQLIVEKAEESQAETGMIATSWHFSSTIFTHQPFIQLCSFRFQS